MWLGGYIMIIRLEQVLDAIETADDAFTYFFDTQTGETVFLSDPMITGESYEELEELIESSGDRFLRFPTKYDIHEYSIMENFVYSLPAGAARQELANAICGKGAFRRFKNGIGCAKGFWRNITLAFTIGCFSLENCGNISQKLMPPVMSAWVFLSRLWRSRRV